MTEGEIALIEFRHDAGDPPRDRAGGAGPRHDDNGGGDLPNARNDR